MSGTGTLVRQYLERAIIEAGAAMTLRDPDVRAELDELQANLDRHDEAIAIARAMEHRLDRMAESLDRLAENLEAAIERVERLG
jgi:hypothetical protein